MSETRHKRRRLLIDSFQYRMLGIAFVYLAAAVLILATAIFLPVMIDLRSGPVPDSGDAAAAAEFLALHARFWPALGITILLVMVHALVTSHRIAGPLYRFRATYKDIAEGKLPGGVGIRKNDYLGKDAHALDAMIEALRERFREIREGRDRAAALLPELRDAVDEDAPARVHELLERLSARMEELDEQLAELRIEEPDAAEPAGTPSPGPEVGGREPDDDR